MEFFHCNKRQIAVFLADKCKQFSRLRPDTSSLLKKDTCTALLFANAHDIYYSQKYNKTHSKIDFCRKG